VTESSNAEKVGFWLNDAPLLVVFCGPAPKVAKSDENSWLLEPPEPDWNPDWNDELPLLLLSNALANRGSTKPSIVLFSLFSLVGFSASFYQFLPCHFGAPNVKKYASLLVIPVISLVIFLKLKS
jgi:hypothetical protein